MNLRTAFLLAAAVAASACTQTQDGPVDVDGSSSTSSGGLAGSRDDSVLLRGRFAALPDRGGLVAYPARKTVRHDGAYTWHRADLSEAHARAAIGGVLAVTTPTGEVLRFHNERHVQHEGGDWTWVGSIAGRDDLEAVITFGAKAAFGTISQPGKAPLRLTLRDGVAWLVETNPAKIASIVNSATRPNEPDYLVPPSLASLSRRGARISGSATSTMSAPSAAAAGATAVPSSAPATTVDLVLGYTPGFATYYGGESQALTRLNNMVAITNEAYVNSRIDAQIRLVKALAVNYTDANANKTALEELTGYQARTRTTPAAAFSELRAARETYSADLVSLVRSFRTPENEGCGIAWLNGGGRASITQSSEFFGYSVVSDGRDQDTDGKTYFCREETLAHELGHNMGSAHDRDASDGDDDVLQSNEYGAFEYSFGFKAASDAGNFYTVMAYGDRGQTTYRVFSNPRVSICGERACGVENQADNARSINQTITAIAQFRTSATPPPPPPPPPPPTRTLPVINDVDGDGKSDLIWRSPATSYFETWIMNGSMFTHASGYSMMANTRIITSGDFNGDGKVDILAADTSNALQMWIGNGVTFTSAALGRNVGPGWRAIGQVDVNADGKGDLIWVHDATNYFETWVMDGTTLVAARGHSLPTNARVMTAGEFSGDGNADLLVYTVNANELSVHIGTGTGFNAVSMDRNFGPAWTAIAAGDLNGDNKTDLFWRSPNTPYFEVWAMDSATMLTANGYTPPVGQRIVGTGDFNNDKYLDLMILDSGNYLIGWMGTTGLGFKVEPFNRTVGPAWTPLIAGQ